MSFKNMKRDDHGHVIGNDETDGQKCQHGAGGNKPQNTTNKSKNLDKQKLIQLAKEKRPWQKDFSDDEVYEAISNSDIEKWTNENSNAFDDDYDEEFKESKDSFYSPDNIIKRQRKIEDEFEMPEEEGWEPSEFGEKSFIKNKDKDNEMFIQYNGGDYDGNNQEWVAGYMKNGEYVDKKFGSMQEAKEFLDNADNEYKGYKILADHGLDGKSVQYKVYEPNGQFLGSSSTMELAKKSIDSNDKQPNVKYDKEDAEKFKDAGFDVASEDEVNEIFGKKPQESLVEKYNRMVGLESQMHSKIDNAKKNGQSPQQVLDSVAYDMDLQPGTEEYDRLKNLVMYDTRLNKDTGSYEYNKYNIGSNKQVSGDERKKLQDLSDAFNKAGLENNLEDTWEDYGARMGMTNLIHNNVQVLNPKDWMDYMNGNASAEEIIDRVKNSPYKSAYKWKPKDVKKANQLKMLARLYDKATPEEAEVINELIEELKGK